MDTSSFASTPVPGESSAAAEKNDATKSLNAQAVAFGRVDAEGNVWVKDGDEERMIGGYPDGVPEEPLGLYVRRYEDLAAAINLFEARLATLSPKDIDNTLRKLEEQVKSPAAVGDLPALRSQVAALVEKAATRKEEIKVERQEAKREALEKRTAFVEAAEKIAETDPSRIQWKQSGQKLRELLDGWKESQRRGPRLDKSDEDALWKRFSAARTIFDRNRRQFFAQLDAEQADAKKIKEQLISEAEKLQDSTEWGPTSTQYRRLMDDWKKAGRASRKDDDALWARFRAAQQVFFDRRREHDQELDQTFQENLVAKEKLIEQAQKILPVENLEDAKAQLRQVQDAWEEIGRVPSRDVSRVEGEMRRIEQAVRQAEEDAWRRSNPETQARAQGMLAQLEESIAKLEADQDAAKSKGDSKAAEQIGEALKTKKLWLEQVRSSME